MQPATNWSNAAAMTLVSQTSQWQRKRCKPLQVMHEIQEGVLVGVGTGLQQRQHGGLPRVLILDVLGRKHKQLNNVTCDAVKLQCFRCMFKALQLLSACLWLISFLHKPTLLCLSLSWRYKGRQSLCDRTFEPVEGSILELLFCLLQPCRRRSLGQIEWETLINIL